MKSTLAKRSEPEGSGEALPKDSYKRLKSINGDKASSKHHTLCNEATCPGCSTGEVEICFVGPSAGGESKAISPTAADLYRMALEERDGVSGETEPSGLKLQWKGVEEEDKDSETKRKIIIKLFEMGVEKFSSETGIPIKAPEVNGSNVSTAAATKNGTPNARDLNARLMFASCMLDFGCYLPLSLYIQRSVDLFTECIQILEGAGTAYLSTWGASAAQFGLGRAKMELVRSRYTDLDDEDDDQENGNGESHYVIPQDELALVESAKATLAKGLASVKNDAEAYARQCIYAAGLFRDYAAVQRQRPTSKRSSTNLLSTLRTALDYLQQAESASGPSVTSNVHALGLRGACLYYLADHYANGEAEADRKETSKYVTEAEAALKSAVTLWDKMPDKQDEHGTEYLQLWGQTLILLSTIEPDEEEAVQYFETGVSTLKRAYQLDPGNDDLEEQLEMLGAMDGGHGDEDEDGSLHGDENGQEQEQDKE